MIVGRNARPCVVCGKPLPDGKQYYRRDTCSKACRQKKYRRHGQPPSETEQRKDAAKNLREALRLCKAAQSQLRFWRLTRLIEDLEKVLEEDLPQR